MPVPILTPANRMVEAATLTLLDAPGIIAALDWPVDQVAPEVVALGDLSKSLSAAKQATEVALAERLSDDVYEGDGFTLQRRWSTSRTEWDDDALVSKLNAVITEQARFDTDGTARTAEEAVAAAIDLFHRVTNVKGRTLRMGALRQLGINPNNYCTTTGGILTLQVVRPS